MFPVFCGFPRRAVVIAIASTILLYRYKLSIARVVLISGIFGGLLYFVG